MNKYRKIILVAGTGQIGQALKRYFEPLCDEIIILTRGKNRVHKNITYLNWNAQSSGAWFSSLENADMIINLAGKNVNCRYNEKNKKAIFDSRTQSIEALGEAISQCKVKPKLWIQCSSATIYRHAQDRPMTEEKGEIGEGFSVEVCKKWEKTFWEESKRFKEMRKVILRTSLVLSKEEGVFPRLEKMVKYGLGGKQGSGNQMVSWIHEGDVCGIVEWILNHNEIKGEINCTAPVPLTNKDFMQAFRHVIGVKIGLPAPKWLLEAGAFFIGTETELILKSRWVIPEKIQNFGYVFKFPRIEEAVRNILSEEYNYSISR